ncbi:MAG: class I SAM-dependent methyltransferase [Proteobacteria bacterium]|nr:class I SAM-dependent methyltransferase [Pseudomonadota bacterium]
MPERPFAHYAARNAPAILEVLLCEFRNSTRVLEIGSGTGQHAVTFAAALGHLNWQTSDLDENHAGIAAWLETAALGNVEAPLSLDVRKASVDSASYDAAFSANTAHIMGIDAVERMFSLLGKALNGDGVFCLYGPFRVGGRLNTDSNEAFDASLRRRDAAMGIRDLEALDGFASAAGMHRTRLYAVPSNNCVAVWRKGAAA